MELEDVDKEFIENLNKGRISDISVNTEYILYSSVDNEITTTVLNGNEVKKLLGSDRSGKKITESDLVNLKRRFSRLSQNTVKSTLKASNSESEALMKKTIVATKVKRGKKYKASCSYICSWLVNPSERFNDVMAIGWENGEGTYDYSENYSAYYTATRNATIRKRNYATGKIVTTTEKESYSKNLTKSMRKNAVETGLSCKAKLFEDGEEIYDMGSMYTYYNFSKHKFTMNFYIDDLSKYTYFVGKYMHQKRKGAFKINAISISFNIASGDATLEISGGYDVSKYYKKIGDNCLKKVYW